MQWIIVFYQVIVSLPEGEILFSGIGNGHKSIKLKVFFLNIMSLKNTVKKN